MVKYRHDLRVAVVDEGGRTGVVAAVAVLVVVDVLRADVLHLQHVAALGAALDWPVAGHLLGFVRRTFV